MPLWLMSFFAFGGTQELALVGVDAQAIVVGERGGQRGDVLVADVELAAGDMGQLGSQPPWYRLHSGRGRWRRVPSGC